MIFYRNVLAAALEIAPNEAMRAITDVVKGFTTFRYFGTVGPAQVVELQGRDAFPAQDVPRLHSTE
jgi:hypothetical protein